MVNWNSFEKMRSPNCVLVVLILHLILVDGLLLDNINNQQKTTPSSSSHQDALVFLMQEVMQIKTTLQEKTKELDKLRSTVANQSSMFFNLTKDLESLMNGSTNVVQTS